MKKVFLIILLILSGCLAGYGQDVSSKLDQDAPRNKNAGRVVGMKKVMTITDEQGGFFFRMPEDMQNGADGSIYLKDYYQLLRFNEKGKLLNNYHKEGQGPGEFGFQFSYALSGDSVIVFSSMPNKIIWFDKKGALIREFRMKEFAFGNLLLYRNEKYYFVTAGMPWIKGKPRIVDVDHTIVEFDKSGFNYKKLISFPVKEYAITEGQARKTYGVGRFRTAVKDDRYFIITHTPVYLVKIYDVEENKLLRVFSRKFKRQPWSEKRWKGDKMAPKIEFDNDIQEIFLSKDKIWIVTSMQDPQKGRLIDVFDCEGNYLDNFYLKLNGKIYCNDERHLFVREEGKYGNPFFVKYRVEK